MFPYKIMSKSTIRLPFTFTKMTMIKKQKMASVGKDIED